MTSDLKPATTHPQNVGYVFGSSTKGQRSLYELGLTGIPITNCNNNCSTGSTALLLSHSLVAGGLARCTLALGFEKMQVGEEGGREGMCYVVLLSSPPSERVSGG